MRRRWGAVFGCTLALGGCARSDSSSPAANPPGTGAVQVRFLEGAPSLDVLVNGIPTDLGAAYLTVGGTTIASSFPYGTLTPFSSFPAGTLSLKALDSSGYALGPVKTAALAAGKSYTAVLVGTYPDYRVVTFEEPNGGNGASLAVYEASPAFPSADFGSFRASTRSNFKKLGNARFGSLATASLGNRVSNFGAYVGTGVTPIPNGALTLQSVDSFDSASALPFHNALRFSLFVLDPLPGAPSGPVFGSLDQ
jgi:hypothetical protein